MYSTLYTQNLILLNTSTQSFTCKNTVTGDGACYETDVSFIRHEVKPLEDQFHFKKAEKDAIW